MYDETPYQPPLRSRATRSFAARSKSSVRGFLFAHLPAQDRPRQIIYESNLERRVPDRPVFVANFKDIERWSHEGILRAAPHIVDPVPKYPTSPLSSVGKVSYGLQKSPANRPTSHARPYLAVVNVQRWRLDLNKIKMISVPDEDMPKYRLEYGDVLLCEGNSPDLVGRGAIWRDEIPDCVHQNHVLRVRLDQTKALPEFVLSVINSSYGQAYFRSKAKRTTNLASINSKEVGSFPLPLPTVPEQQDMIDQLFAGQAAAKQKRDEAAKARAKAWADFETAVYAAEVVEGTAAQIAAACGHIRPHVALAGTSPVLFLRAALCLPFPSPDQFMQASPSGRTRGIGWGAKWNLPLCCLPQRFTGGGRRDADQDGRICAENGHNCAPGRGSGRLSQGHCRHPAARTGAHTSGHQDSDALDRSE
ncbi:MAG: hypothetical protein U1E41_05125 [Paracoccus sp. (in: a-proteobacteria)]